MTVALALLGGEKCDYRSCPTAWLPCSCQSPPASEASKRSMAGQFTQKQLLTSPGSANTSLKARSIHTLTR